MQFLIRKYISSVSLILAILSFVSLFSLYPAQAQDTLRRQEELEIVELIKATPWNAAGRLELSRILADEKQFNLILNYLYNSDFYQETVGEYQITDLNNDGIIEIVCTVDLSGRGFYNTLLIIRLENLILTKETLRGYQITLDRAIADPNSDGIKEIVIPNLLEDYEGSKPLARFYDVYSLINGKYAKVSSNFKSYYRDTILPEIRQALNDLSTDFPNDPDTQEEWRAKYTKEIQAINNFLNDGSNVNLLKNPSFDEGQPGLGLTALPAWTVWQGNVDVIPGSPSNSLGVWHQAADGPNSLELIGTPGVGGIAQAVPTATGKKYKLSGSIAHHPGVSQAGVWVWIGDQWVPTPLYHSGQASQANMNWQRFNIEFTAKSDSTVIGFIDRNLASYDYGGAVLDGLSVTLVDTTGNVSEAAPRATSSSESITRAVTSEEMLQMMLAHPSVKGDPQKQAAIRKQFAERGAKAALTQPVAMRFTPTPPPRGKEVKR
jgi:hypothetical protein